MFNFIKKGVGGIENREKSDKEKRKKEKKPNSVSMSSEELRLDEVRFDLRPKNKKAVLKMYKSLL